MAAKTKSAAKTDTKVVAADAPKASKITGPTSGVMAQGKVGKAAREAAQNANAIPGPVGWRDPNSTYADDDNSIDARMWRLNRDHQEMGSR